MTKREESDRRLGDDEIVALDYVFGGMEAAVGVKSSYGAQIDRIAGLRSGTARSDALTPLEYWGCWSTRGRRQAGLSAYHALLAMLEAPRGSLHVSVLYRAYGPKPPGPDFESLAELGVLGRLVAFTDVAIELAKAAGAQSIVGAVAEVVLAPRPKGPKATRPAAPAGRAALLARLSEEADGLLADAVVAYRAARATVRRGDDVG